MIDRGHALSISRQAKALGINRSSVYCLPRPVSEAAVLIVGDDHQHAEPDHIGKAVDDLILRGRIRDAARQTFGDTKALLDLPQNQNACIRRQGPPLKRATTGLQ